MSPGPPSPDLPDESLRAPLEALAARDPEIAEAYALWGLPQQRRRHPGFAGLITIVAAQQLSIHAAGAIVARLEAACRPLTAERFLALEEAELRAIGFSRSKLRYGHHLAEALVSGDLDLEQVHALEDEAAIEALMQLKGIGRWSAEIYLLFALRRPDVFPAGDLALQVAMQRLKGLDARPDAKEAAERALAWAPHRGAAARFLWHFYRHAGVPEAG